jgi:D-amino-acid dehydrogenase
MAKEVLILGAGVSGVLAAYFLGREGYQVRVIDRQDTAAMECSFANGGQLSYSHAEPWANPAVFPKVFKWMFRDDAPLVMRFSADPQMIRWGLEFLWNCRPSAAHRNSRALMKLGLHSKEVMAEIMAETGVAFHHSDKGILHVFSSQKGFDDAVKQVQFQEKLGCHEQVMNMDECLKLEPSLAKSTKPLYGGVYAPIDEMGDVHLFTQELADYCVKHFKAEFLYHHEIIALEAQSNRITHVVTNQGNLSADEYVLALGAYSPLLTKPLGFRLPIYPMKGYSITFNATEDMPELSVTDDDLKIVYTRLGDKIRCAGTAEFAGYNTSLSQKRIDPIMRGIRTLFPQADLSEVSEWACLRPSTPDGPPIIGKTPLENLYLNTGHGTLGWTQGAATADLLASVMTGREPRISMDGLTLKRYG